MKVLIVGTGLMGGSFALKLKAHNHTIAGFDTSKSTLQKAVNAGILETSFEKLEEGLTWANAILLTIPVTAIRELLPVILDQLSEDQFIIDFGSTKANICQSVSSHPNRKRYLAAHPIAGTEYSGPEAAFAELYDEKTMIVCEPEKTAPPVIETFENWCSYSNMKMVEMTPENHDLHLAYISHLSHVIAYSLSNVVLEKEKDGELILELAGSGFASTVRLAKSSPEMWAPIFLDNKDSLISSIDNLRSQLETMKEAIIKNDKKKLDYLLSEGRKIRKILK